MEKIIFVGLGCSLIIFGIGIFLDPIFYDSKHGVTIDFTGINHLFGIFNMVVGSLLLWTTFRKRNKNKDNSGNLQ